MVIVYILQIMPLKLPEVVDGTYLTQLNPPSFFSFERDNGDYGELILWITLRPQYQANCQLQLAKNFFSAAFVSSSRCSMSRVLYLRI
jgi:hypothetical protein